MGSVGSGQLQSGSVGSLQVRMAAIATAHIQDACITRAKIAEATVGELNTEAITAITARIEELDVYKRQIKQMSTEVATSANDIAEVVAIAGQLGIETDYLTEFARTMIDLGNSTDIVADEAASVLAKFANITGMNQSEFDNLGASLVDLGNNCATTESAIMNLSLIHISPPT